MQIVHLSPELLLNVASFLPQVDLLNVSLTCKHLRIVTEPELYREYINPYSSMFDERSIKPFVLRLLERPELGKYVRRVDLRAYSHLSDLNPELGPPPASPPVECTHDEYQRCTQAAVTAGVIKNALPYEAESSVWKKMKSRGFQLTFNEGGARGWYEHIYDDDSSRVSIQDVPYDIQFCKLLRLSVDDPLVVLLMALLPNLHELDLWGTPHHPYALTWRANHHWRNLKSFTASATDGEQAWPLEFFKPVLGGGNLESLRLYHAGSGWRENAVGAEEFGGDYIPVMLSLPPRSTNITHLTLQYCTFTKDEMRMILQACAPLKFLYYSTGGQKLGPENFTVPDLVELLQPHQTSLEELYLDLEDCWDFEGNLEPIPSLRAFTALKTIDTNMATFGDLLLGPTEPDDDIDAAINEWLQTIATEPLAKDAPTLCDHLPPSLTKLILQELHSMGGPQDWDFRQLEHLISNRDHAFANLKSIVYVEYESGNAEEVYDEFPDMVARANVDYDSFNFVVCSLDEYRRAYGTVFLTEKHRPREPTKFTRWRKDRYVTEGWRPAMRDPETGAVLPEQMLGNGLAYIGDGHTGVYFETEFTGEETDDISDDVSDDSFCSKNHHIREENLNSSELDEIYFGNMDVSEEEEVGDYDVNSAGH